MLNISVIIPCGPLPETELYLPEMIESICKQTELPNEVVIIDDAAHISQECKDVVGVELFRNGIKVQWLKNQWNLGESSSRNIATVNASNDWVFQAAYDDRLFPRCLEMCWKYAHQMNFDTSGYYYVVLEIDGQEEKQGQVGAHAMFHKDLWARLGGYPLVGCLGLADIGFIDLVMTKGGKIYQVKDWALYWHRTHKNNGVYLVPPALRHYARELANENTANWKYPEWVRGYGFS